MLRSARNNENPLRPPEVTADSWSIYDPVNKAFIAGKKDKTRKEIASISKIMTCIVCLEIAEEENISLFSKVTVSSLATRIRGTSSNLIENDELRIIDLLYGMMLPSGNDSAMALALFFGKFYHDSLPVIGFVKVMNYMSEFLNLHDTFFQNPHGMSVRPNFSSAQDIGVLASYALKNKLFREIVSSAEYTCEITNSEIGSREVMWSNTNKLLESGFDGVKTGTTEKAGACLCARIKDQNNPWIITVLKSNSSEDRWKDVLHLADWVKKTSANR